jgi:CheY-like chemotaxis protein
MDPILCVLIVEDDDDSRDLLGELVGSLGHRVVKAADAHEALEFGSATAWDVALIDLHLCGVDGYEVARRLRACSTGRAQRLIALTGFSDTASRDAAKAAGFDHFVVKPVLPEQLIKVLQG